jgi:hypothetical protein
MIEDWEACVFNSNESYSLGHKCDFYDEDIDVSKISGLDERKEIIK